MQAPHDTLFQFTFAHPEHASGWVRSLVPTAVRAAIDWTSLRPARERLPGLRLRPLLADLVFAATRHDRTGTVLLVVEHKSYPDSGLPHQLLRYAVFLQRSHQKAHGVPVPVLAFVLQHGPTMPHGREDRDPLRRFQPRMHHIVDDRTVARRPAPRRGLTPLAELTLRCLHALPDAAPEVVPDLLTSWAPLLRAVDRAEGPPQAPPLGADAVDAIGWYALAVSDVDPHDLAAAFHRILHRPEDTIMSTLERTFQKGHTEGKAEGKAEVLLRQLARRFSPLPASTTARVRDADPAELDRFADRILDAKSLDEVLGDDS